jgi:hypothetical protein
LARDWQDATSKAQHKVNSTKRVRWINLWLCRCDCGGDQVTVREHLLLEGRTTSCGCLRRKREEEVSPDERAATAAFRALLASTMQARALPWRLLRARWLGDPSPIAATMGVQARTGKAFEEILRRTAPRVPEEDEARFLAEILNLRGMDKERFLKAARNAREAIAAQRAESERHEVVGPESV